jgi:glycosyltransferase involved in cell wall biosynthesis
VLRSLDTQTLEKSAWELLLIDNGSRQPLSQSWDLTWHPRARHVREPVLGLTAARLRGIKESTGEMLVFVDDDNVLDDGYLRTALDLLRDHPHLGTLGAGRLVPEFAVNPPRQLVPYLDALALRDVASPSWSEDTRDNLSVPWGAGLCVRRRVALAYEPLLGRLGVRELVDRKGDRLYGNGDVAFSWSAVTCGLGFGVFPQLAVTHLISKERLTASYFLRLARDSSFSNGVLDFLWAGTVPGRDAGTTVRLLLRGLRRGLFALRHSWAAARGASQARELIRARALRPIRSNESGARTA